MPRSCLLGDHFANRAHFARVALCFLTNVLIGVHARTCIRATPHNEDNDVTIIDTAFAIKGINCEQRPSISI